jgi:hypothetical protein
MIHDRIKHAPGRHKPMIKREDAFSIQRFVISDQLETIIPMPPEAVVLSADSSGHDMIVFAWAPSIPRDTKPVAHRFYCISEDTAFLPPAGVKLIGVSGGYKKQHIFHEEPDET